MLIDDTHPEETRVVVIDGNKLDDVEFESASRKQIKGNVYLAKVMRVEPSLQAAFVDYGGNKHGFLAFGEIHPDYYNIDKNKLAEIEKEINDTIEAKRQAITLKKLEEQKAEQEKTARKEAEDIRRKKIEEEKSKTQDVVVDENSDAPKQENKKPLRTKKYPAKKQTSTKEAEVAVVKAEEVVAQEEILIEATGEDAEKSLKNRSKRLEKKATAKKPTEKEEKLKVLSEKEGCDEDTIYEDSKNNNFDDDSSEDDDDDDDFEDGELEHSLELQKKLLIARKLYHNSKIQDVIKEGQILLVQVDKEERGNKGAALTTYLSLAGRYCVLMPNRVKSGGVSRKITSGTDRKRLKSILKELPLNSDMSMIVRTAGEDKSKEEICRDYNYLIRNWNQIRLDSLRAKAPSMIYEEANLIKRSLRDMYTKDIAEVIVEGEEAFKAAKNLIRILSPQSLKKIKFSQPKDAPLFQRFQVEGQIEKLHDTTVQLESGGYLVINPTEALVAIDVNSGRATRENNLEETALNTNLEAADEIARQLRLRNLAGLVVVDFIDMDHNSNNSMVEKRIKEALKKDRSRVQVGKMSQFGLIEISRQRMHPSFFETSYKACPHCMGKGIIRTVESSSVFILRELESEAIKNLYSALNVFLPIDVALYLLNNKRDELSALETRYNFSLVVSADDSIKHINQYRLERTRKSKNNGDDEVVTQTATPSSNNNSNPVANNNPNARHNGNNKPHNGNGNANKPSPQNVPVVPTVKEEVSASVEAVDEVVDENKKNNRNNHNRKNRFNNNRRRNDNRNERFANNRENQEQNHQSDVKENSSNKSESVEKKGKSTWWRKIIGG